jgi:hypothetical protein
LQARECPATAFSFGDLVGKLDVLVVAGAKYARAGPLRRAPADRVAGAGGKIVDLEEIVAGRPTRPGPPREL